MTMKRQKTLHRFAAVAAVLLALCLVFATPAGATEECTGCDNNDNEGHTHVAWTDESGSKTYYATISSAINAVSANGGTVYLMSGTITDAVDLRLPENTGDSVKTIKIYGVNHAQNPDEWSDSQTVLTGRIYLNFYGGDQDGYDFEIKGITFQGTGVSVYTRANITIQNNVFKDIATSESISAIHVSSGTNEGKVQKADISSNHFINVTKKGANGAVAILASKETCNDCITKDNFFDDGCLSASCGEGHAQHVAWIIDGSTTKYYATVSSALDAVAKKGGTIYLISGTIDECPTSAWDSDELSQSPKDVKIYGVNYATTPDKWEDAGQTILTGGMDLGKTNGVITDYNVEVKGITFQTYGISVLTQQEVVIENNKFSSMGSPMPGSTNYAITVKGSLASPVLKTSIINNQITGVTQGHGIEICYSKDVFIRENIIKNTNEHSILLSGYIENSAEITGNTLENWGQNKKGRAVRIDIGKKSGDITLTSNVMIHDSLSQYSEQFVKISGLGTDSIIDVSANYWNGANPTSTFTGLSGTTEYYYMKESTGVVDPAVLKSYYADVALTQLIPLMVTPSFEVTDTEGTQKVTVDGTSATISEDKRDGNDVLVIKRTDEESSVVLVISGGEKDSTTVTIPKDATVTAEYPSTSAETDENVGEVSFTLNVDIKDISKDLPVITPEFKQDVANKITEAIQVLAMLSTVGDGNSNLKTGQGLTPITITFQIPVSLVEELGGTKCLAVFHVKDGNAEEKDIISIVKEGDNYLITIKGSSFSSYALAVVEPEEIIYTGGGTDTGSGNYQYYPRSVPTDGIISFGTSKVITGMELPAGSDGTVTLNIKPTFAMPENGFYAFEIDAPGYNLDAKINGGLSFQIPVADLEAAGWTAEDIVLFHGTVGEDGTITWEALPTNLVKNENGVAYYKAAINGCSPFYIGFVKDGSVVNTEVVDPTTPETPVTPDEPEVLPPVDEPETPEQPTESPAPILAVLAGLGAAVVLRRK